MADPVLFIDAANAQSCQALANGNGQTHSVGVVIDNGQTVYVCQFCGTRWEATL